MAATHIDGHRADACLIAVYASPSLRYRHQLSFDSFTWPTIEWLHISPINGQLESPWSTLWAKFILSELCVGSSWSRMSRGMSKDELWWTLSSLKMNFFDICHRCRYCCIGNRCVPLSNISIRDKSTRCRWKWLDDRIFRSIFMYSTGSAFLVRHS